MCVNIKEFKNQLESELKRCSKVFIIGHNSPDFDSIGSAIGLYALAVHYGKKAYIIIDDDEALLESGVKKLLDDNNRKFKIIKKDNFEKLIDKKSLLILTDVNKKNMISIGDSLDKLKSIVIIDHHNEDENTIQATRKFISEDVSSASEVVARLLFDLKVKVGPTIANFLLAGINLDTKRFKQNTSSKTHDVAEKLIDRGADIDYVNNLFLEEFESFTRISNLIINGTIIKKYSESLAPIQVSFTLDRNNPKEIYLKEDYAKAADRMMKFIGIDAAFALGYVDDKTIHISARGGKKVNVGNIMSEMNGGGNSQSAGGRIESEDVLGVEEDLMNKISFGLSDEEPVVETPKVIKVKQIRRHKKT